MSLDIPDGTDLSRCLFVNVPSDAAQPPKLLDRVRQALRLRHYSRRTEESYVGWIRRFILFHGKRHPTDMGAAEITAFLTSLATRARVSASTQNQALSALLRGNYDPFDLRCRRRLLRQRLGRRNQQA